jgi:Flp pilus assembly protein TadG
VHRRAGHRESGASLVEFAFVVPVLTLFLFGIVQFGLAYDMKQSINSAAREGARAAAIPDEANVTYSSIRSRVNNSFTAFVSDTADTVEVKVVTASTPTQVRKTCTASGSPTPTDSCTTTIPASSPTSKSPCTNQAGQTVVVTVTELHEITIPFFGVRNVTLTGKGEFRCEIDA